MIKESLMGENGQITREYAMSKALDLREIAALLDGGSHPAGQRDGTESIGQRLRQAAFVIEMTAPKPSQLLERIQGL